MARTSIIANLGKMLKVRSGVSEGLSVSKACKAASTSSGTYKKWLERYAALGTPLAVEPLSDGGRFQFSGDSNYLYALNFDDSGMLLTRIDTTTGERITHHTDESRQEHSYPSVVTARASHTGDSVLFLRNKGELRSWHPETDTIKEHNLNLKDSAVGLDNRTSSGVRRWSTVAFSHDLLTVAFWHRTSSDSQGVLKIVDVLSGEERLSKVFVGRHLRPQLNFHPTRPLLGFLTENQLITILNHQTGELLVDGGPQAHSVSFSTGDTLLFDDWYGKTKVFNYVTGKNAFQSPGWGSHGSQSTRFITARQDELHLRDTADSSINTVLKIDEIIECSISTDGRFLAIRTDHLGIWDTASLLEGHEAR